MTNQETLELALNALKCLFGLPDKFTGKGGDVAVWRLGGSYRAQEAIKALEEALGKQEPDYKALWQQMCERCDELDAKLAKQEQGEPVAWFDNAGTIHGRVSDEQLDLLCRSAVAEISKRNGWSGEDPSRADYERLQALVTSQGIRLMEYESTVYTKPQQRAQLPEAPL